MARTTYLGAVNNVLAKLRRDPVASVATSTYASLIGQLVNQSKREVEEAWAWTELRTALTVTTDITNQSYRLTGFGDRYRIHEVWNVTQSGRILPATDYAIERWEFTSSNSAGTPAYWRISGLEAGDPKIEFERVPDQVYDIRVVATVSQADLSSDATEISVPHWPVELGAYRLAISERGEDGGLSFDEASREYESALSDAVAADNMNKVRGATSDWRVE